MICICIKPLIRKIHTWDFDLRCSRIVDLVCYEKGDQYICEDNFLKFTSKYMRIWKCNSIGFLEHRWIEIETFKKHFDYKEEEEWEDISDEMCM